MNLNKKLEKEPYDSSLKANIKTLHVITNVAYTNIQMGNFIWGRVYGLGKIGREKVYDSLEEYSPLGSQHQALLPFIA